MKRPLSPFEQELVNAMEEYAHRSAPPAFHASRIVAGERRRVRVRVSLAAVCVATAAGIASCVATSVPGNGKSGLPVVGGTPTPVTATASPTSSASPNPQPSPSGAAGGSPSATTGAGSSASPGDALPPFPTTPTSSPFAGSVPPVPVLNSLTVNSSHGSAGSFEVAVFEFAGQVPGFRARYVDQVVREGSGAPVSLPGSAFLQLVFTSAQAHDDSGNPTLHPAATNPVAVNKASIRSYVLNGDFEGTVTVTLGMSGRDGFQITEFTKSPTDHLIKVLFRD
jgi:hypothetical protein